MRAGARAGQDAAPPDAVGKQLARLIGRAIEQELPVAVPAVVSFKAGVLKAAQQHYSKS